MAAADGSRRALVVGATGIVGQNLGTRLVAEGWEVHGLSRSGRTSGEGVHPVRADLSGEELTVKVLPKQDDEFTCASCFLVHHRSRLAEQSSNGRLICRDCAA